MFKFRKKKREKVNSIEQTQKDYVSNVISKDEYLKKLREYAMIDKDKISFFWECFEKNIKDTLVLITIYLLLNADVKLIWYRHLKCAINKN